MASTPKSFLTSINAIYYTRINILHIYFLHFKNCIEHSCNTINTYVFYLCIKIHFYYMGSWVHGTKKVKNQWHTHTHARKYSVIAHGINTNEKIEA